MLGTFSHIATHMTTTHLHSQKKNSPHLRQLSVNIQFSGLIKFREDLGDQMQLTQVSFCSQRKLRCSDALQWVYLRGHLTSMTLCTIVK